MVGTRARQTHPEGCLTPGPQGVFARPGDGLNPQESAPRRRKPRAGLPKNTALPQWWPACRGDAGSLRLDFDVIQYLWMSALKVMKAMMRICPPQRRPCIAATKAIGTQGQIATVNWQIRLGVVLFHQRDVVESVLHCPAWCAQMWRLAGSRTTVGRRMPMASRSHRPPCACKRVRRRTLGGWRGEASAFSGCSCWL